MLETQLSPWAQQVDDLLRAGYTHQEIAKRLDTTVYTIYKRLSNEGLSIRTSQRFRYLTTNERKRRNPNG